tara:strand:- start:321 stop:869 length:549 start_codon:yes stop_codon:yes gene_type:complete
MKALLIIDMQKASFAEAERYDASGVVRRINDLSERMREGGGQVIFIQHDGCDADGHKAHTEGWEILDELVKKEEDLLVRKTSCDSFYETGLELILNDLKIKELIVTGCATDFCVDTTIRTSLSKDFSVTIPRRCHTTADRPHLKAIEVIEHHEWVWKDLIAPNSRIRVLPFEEVVKESVLGS